MPHKLKSSARRSRRNRKIGIVSGLIILVAVIATAAVYMVGGFNPAAAQYGLLAEVRGSGSTNATGTQKYDAGALVTVQANANSDWVLSEWLLNGNSVGSVNPYVVSMSENRNLTAVFTELPHQDRVLLQTSMGNITIELRDDKPNTSGNFKKLVQQGMYDGTIFHRVIEGFMIQGGEVTGTVSSIPDEIGSNNHNVKGTIAMAKTSQPNSATSGFFINVVDNSKLSSTFDTTYTVFGNVVEGMDVAEAISHVPVDDPTSQSPRPLTDVLLIKAIILP